MEEQESSKEKEMMNKGECKLEENQVADGSDSEEVTKKGRKKRKRSKLFDCGSKRGVCYLSRIPPHMDPASLRHVLSQYGEIERLYLAPTDPSKTQVNRKRPGTAKGHAFTEGWVEFAKRSVAKRIASMLNGEQMGGRRRSSFYYDIWNIKYLRKFKWDDLTEEIAHRNATREQKLALEISAAKRERNYTLSKFAQSRALKSIKERLEKKRKIDHSEAIGDLAADQRDAKIFRRFPQNKPVDKATPKRGTLSEDILTGVFSNNA